jgi:hypothetical protein
MAAPAAGFETLPLFLQLPITPVSSNHGCDESRQTPIRIKRVAMNPPVALAASPPQKNVGIKRGQTTIVYPLMPHTSTQDQGPRHSAR